MVIDGQQEGLLLRGLPPLVDGGIVLPEFVEAGAFPSAAGFGASFWEADEVGKMRLDKRGDGFAVALEAEADFQFIGGQLMKMAVEKGRSTRKDLKIGICGEHGGEPASVEFCHSLGFNYVSCSPFRVPIARLAAAQAVIKQKKAAAKPAIKKVAKKK